jgi:hypothetical protein
MRRQLRWAATLANPFGALTRLWDERNIRRLSRHLHCSIGDAREIYVRARRDGFGSAHAAVLGGRRDPGAGQRVAQQARVRGNRQT